jgi:RND family efflux transporter MFP subunit
MTTPFVPPGLPAPAQAQRPSLWWWGWLGLGLPVALLGVFTAAGCNQAPPPKAPKPVDVEVTTPVTDSVTDYTDFTGRLAAIKTVDIRARVSGYVVSVPFKEGDYVREGQLLFDIDPFTLAADLNQAQANLKLAEADENLQRKLADRAELMFSRKAIAKEEYETTIATLEKSKAAVRAARAARDKAALYMKYTKVTAPLSGRISYRNVDPGNLIVADNTVLTTIVTEDPLYAYFDVDERTYVELAESSHKGETSWFQTLPFPVLMRLATEEDFTHVGHADFIDNRVSANTGTVRMRGVFKNEKGYLKSGLFVRIRLPIGNPYEATLIPDEALQSDQGKKFVYVVDKRDKKARRRYVKLGQAVKGLRVIRDGGIKPGEWVIVIGQQRVREGSQVNAKVQPPPKRPGSPLSKLLASFKKKPQRPNAKDQRMTKHQVAMTKE